MLIRVCKLDFKVSLILIRSEFNTSVIDIWKYLSKSDFDMIGVVWKVWIKITFTYIIAKKDMNLFDRLN